VILIDLAELLWLMLPMGWHVNDVLRPDRVKPRQADRSHELDRSALFMNAASCHLATPRANRSSMTMTICRWLERNQDEKALNFIGMGSANVEPAVILLHLQHPKGVRLPRCPYSLRELTFRERNTSTDSRFPSAENPYHVSFIEP
jgi:hypothetical protein